MSDTKFTVAPLADKIRRTVVVVGSTGVGKSTIINMLYNQSSDKESCLQPAKVGNTAAAVTREPQLYLSIKAQSAFVDTVGFGDPEMSKFQILRCIRKFIDAAVKGINAVVFVLKMGRMSSADRFHLDIFKQLFETRWKEQAVLVLTHYDREIGEEQQRKELEMWCKEDKEIKSFVDSFSKVIITDNGLGRNEKSTRPLRKACLEQLQSSIESWGCTFGPHPNTSLDVLGDMLEAYFRPLTRFAIERPVEWFRTNIKAVVTNHTATSHR